MDYLHARKLIIWLVLTVILMLVFYIGIIQAIELFLFIVIIIVGEFIIISELKFGNTNIKFIQKISIWLILTLNLLFAFSIGLTIPTLVSESKDNLGYIMIPLLIIFNYVILDRLHYYHKHSNDERDKNE